MSRLRDWWRRQRELGAFTVVDNLRSFAYEEQR